MVSWCNWFGFAQRDALKNQRCMAVIVKFLSDKFCYVTVRHKKLIEVVINSIINGVLAKHFLSKGL